MKQGKSFFSKIALGVVCLTAFLLEPTICNAEIAIGRAVIVNGDVERAKRDAREEAMRSFVENKVGTYIDSRTELNMGMVVSDRIVARATGYVQIKSVKREWQQGNIFLVELDLEADQVPIQTAVKDVRERMRLLLEGTTRTAIQVAATGRDENGNVQDLARLNYYMQAKMEDISGFRVMVNDNVRQFLAQQGDMGNLGDSAEARRIARVTREGAEDALLRGTLSTVKIRREKNLYIATVNASFELVGIDDNETSSFSDYFSAVGNTYLEAVNKANDEAARKVAEVMGQKALVIIQQRNRGGITQITATLSFRGITDKRAQEQRILQGLGTANCEVIRSSFTSRGDYKVFVKSTAYANLGALRQGILQNIAGLASDNDYDSVYGGTILYFAF